MARTKTVYCSDGIDDEVTVKGRFPLGCDLKVEDVRDPDDASRIEKLLDREVLPEEGALGPFFLAAYLFPLASAVTLLIFGYGVQHMKSFQTAGVCIPIEHYMANRSEALAQLKALAHAGMYVSFHAPRKTGKTTLLTALGEMLQGEYASFILDLEGLAQEAYETGGIFVQFLARTLLEKRGETLLPKVGGRQ